MAVSLYCCGFGAQNPSDARFVFLFMGPIFVQLGTKIIFNKDIFVAVLPQTVMMFTAFCLNVSVLIAIKLWQLYFKAAKA